MANKTINETGLRALIRKIADWTKAQIPDVEDNLTSTSTTNTLSAKQGKVLNDALTALQSVAVRYDIEQTPTSTQQETARGNISAFNADADPVLAYIISVILARLSAIERNFTDGFAKIKVDDLEVVHALFGSIVGENDMSFILDRSGVPNMIPKFLGQVWVDRPARKVYFAVNNTSVNDFILLN